MADSPTQGSMPAAVLEAPGRLVVREIPVWPIEEYGDPDIVLVEVAACGVCGSDFRYFAGENPWAQHTLGRFVPNPPNIVLGHEFAGTVVRVLHERNERLLGKRVAPVCSKVCGACADCRAGRSRLCPNTVHLGHGQGWGRRDFYPGAYARYAPAWGAGCYEISDDLPFEDAAMMDILAVCVHVCEVGAVQAGRPVLCIGAGPAGNGLAQVAQTMGADRAVLIERSPLAMDVARRQGIGTVLDARRPDLPEALRQLAPEGFGCVFDSVGTESTLDLGLTHLAKTGSLVLLAVHGNAPVPLDLMRLGAERRLVTSCNFEVGDYAKALAWLEAGKLRVSEWLTPVSLTDLPERFAEVMANPDAKSTLKMVVGR
ncbi:MAG: alcohol dehydrogenase catalytic domain-containing protein [Fimbriimonadaceae bacterium]|nr:alcohol dehydrogenase catalytic domain-containing protein [Fimbriimonadaceae bacterium]